jgi:peptidoglycan hydrolase-like protein with peptidoglycan-binding domain
VRRLRVAAVAAILLAAVAAALVALQSGSSSHTATGSGIPPGDTTTTVQRRTLVERAQVDGTLGYSGALEIYNRLAGTFTWLPAVGAVTRRGETLYRLDNLPVVLMYGSVPAYRALVLGVGDGPDVAELNANLVRLGFDPYGAIVSGDRFTQATAAAVRRWQKSEGLPQTGEVQLGRVVFSPGARRVTAVHVVLGQDPPPSSSAEQPRDREKAAGKGNPNADKSKKSKPKSPPAKAKSPAKAKRPSAKKEATKKEATGKGEEGNGSGAAAPELALSTTATRQIVQLQVKATEQQLARVGESAPVTLPNGDVAHGRITSVGTVASESSENEKEKGGGGNPASGNGENATISATLALDRPVARLDKAPVSVELLKSIRRNVLAVPATALVATAGGGYAIQVLAGARRVELAVTPGMFANGYVQIEGPGVRRGLTVIEPQ